MKDADRAIRSFDAVPGRPVAEVTAWRDWTLVPVAQLGVEELFDDARVVCRTFGWATSKTEVAAFDLTAEQPRTYVL